MAFEMNPIDVVLIQDALRLVERALGHLPTRRDSDLGAFNARLDLICAKADLQAALVGNVAKEVA